MSGIGGIGFLDRDLKRLLIVGGIVVAAVAAAIVWIVT